jgi:hypothetical protein
LGTFGEDIDAVRSWGKVGRVMEGCVEVGWGRCWIWQVNRKETSVNFIEESWEMNEHRKGGIYQTSLKLAMN